MYKTVLFVCAQALMIQSIVTQCIGAGLGSLYSSWAAAPWEAASIASPWNSAPYNAASLARAGPWESPYVPEAYGPASFSASNGGGLGVSSTSPIPANGVSIVSENTIEGFLTVTGAMPFLGAVALEGSLPTLGSGAVNFGAGNGAVAIVAEDIASAAAPFGIADAYGPYGAGPIAGYGTYEVGTNAAGYGPYEAGPIAAGYGPYRPYARAGCSALI